ncbi:MAG: hypothetical protein J6W71_06860, partial [Methanobrevibacter sp.]|nr:hypothetical protein [Methanobrevibacter sp.]
VIDSWDRASQLLSEMYLMASFTMIISNFGATVICLIMSAILVSYFLVVKADVILSCLTRIQMQ